MECSYTANCKNHPKKCIYCVDQKYYRATKKHKGLKPSPSSKKKGMDFEDEVLQMYEKQVFGRNYLSGAMIDHRSDIETIKTVMECKSTDVTGGKKQITIKKEYHDDIEEEGRNQAKYPFLIYGFKDEDKFDNEEIYFSTKYTYLLNILFELKTLKQEVYQKEQEIKKLKETIDGTYNK